MVISPPLWWSHAELPLTLFSILSLASPCIYINGAYIPTNFEFHYTQGLLTGFFFLASKVTHLQVVNLVKPRGAQTRIPG